MQARGFYDDQLVSTLPCDDDDDDAAGSFAVPLEAVSTATVVSSGLISPKARFNSWPVVTFLLYSTKLHSR